MSKLIIYRGLPASGKSTAARAWMLEDPPNRAVVTRDDMRISMFGWYPGSTHVVDRKKKEKLVRTERDHHILYALKQGRDVVSADTNLNMTTVGGLYKLAKSVGAEVEIQWFTTPVEECIQRDAARPAHQRVGEEVIRKMWEDSKRFFPPKRRRAEGWPSVIVDIDGTMARNVCRSYYDETLVETDEPNWEVINTVNSLAGSYAILVFSGRSEKCRDATRNWLLKHGVKFEKLLMRAEGDIRPDCEVKLEMLIEAEAMGFSPRMVFDDRLQVCRMWVEQGLFVFNVNQHQVEF